MIIYFNNLSPLKREASFLRKLVKKSFPKTNIKISAPSSLNITAQMYGWENYNRLSQKHENLFNIYKSENSFEEFLAKENIKTINSISNLERKLLESQKKQSLFTSLYAYCDDSNLVEDLIYEFFNRKSKIDKLFGFKKDSLIPFIDGLSFFPVQLWKGGSIFYSNDPGDIKDFILEIPLSSALESGGVFLLRESIANDVIKSLSPALDNDDRLKLFYFSSEDNFKNEIHNSSYLFDPFLYYNLDYDKLSSSVPFLFLSSDISRDEKNIAVELISFMYEENIGANSLFNLLNTDSFQSKVLNLKVLDLLDSRSLSSVNSKLKSASPYIYKRFVEENDKDFLSDNELSYLNKYLDICKKGLSVILDSPFKNEDSLDISNSISSEDNNINIFIIPDSYEEKSHNDSSFIISNLKFSLAPILGMMMEGTSYSYSSRSRFAYKPIFFDSVSDFNSVNGIGIVMAQLKSSGYSSFFVFSDYNKDTKTDRDLKKLALISLHSTIKIYSSRRFYDSLRLEFQRLCVPKSSNDEELLNKVKSALPLIDDGNVLVSIQSEIYCIKI